ncbi:MAG: trimethylamine methyltransferase family protein [Candidatus Thermoplasmatota archaeon]|nr:trimethylamine methyltransferase family protein [Candidatus Thermoplasmatota archaeon]
MSSADFERLSNRKVARQLVDGEAFKRIHDESIGVLEEVGIRIYSQSALALLREHGASTDNDRMIAKLPRNLVEKALSTAPKGLRLRARNPKFDLLLDGSHLYFTFDGCGVQTIDIESGMRRAARKQDIVDCARLANVLPGVGYFTPSVAPQDVPLHAHVLHQMEAAYSNTDKFVVSESTTTAAEARAQIEMAAAVAGGRDELRRSPTLSAIICSVPPLNLDGGGSEAAMEFARAGVPVIMMSMVEAGVSGPVTLAGTLAVSNAEVLAMLTLIQCARKGAPVIYGSVLSMMEPRTGAYVSGSPEAALLCSAVVDLGRHYGIPTQAGTFGTNAALPGSQAATEHCLTTLLAVGEGAEMVNGFGLLDASTVLSFEQLLLDYDIVTEILHMAKGIEVNEDTLAPGLIREVGIGGTYLSKRHTLTHLREAWQPMVFEYGSYDEWMRKGAVDPVRRANEKAKALLGSAPSVPLPTDTKTALQQIVARGEKELR